MKDEQHLLWQTLDRQLVLTTPIFTINTVRRASTDGRQGSFIEIDAPMWATIIPWYRDDEGSARFLMVRQYRHGSNSVTIEFPAGTVDKGESPKEAAVRELLEETGCKPEGEIIELGTISPNPAFMNNRVTIFLAKGIRHVADQSLDANEQLDILSIPVTHVLDSMGTGSYDNGVMMIAQAYFLRYAKHDPDLLHER